MPPLTPRLHVSASVPHRLPKLARRKSGKKGKLKRAASSAALKGGEEPPPPPEPIDAVENHLAFVALLADGTAPCSDEVREACRRLMGAPR